MIRRVARAALALAALALAVAPPAQARRIVPAPADFRFVLRFWANDVYDSGRGEWLLDQVCAPPERLPIALTPARRDTVWTELADLRFFELPPALRHCREGAAQSSLQERWALTVVANGREHSVRWACDLDGRDRRVPLLCRTIVGWLTDTPQFRNRKLPPCLSL